MHPIIAEAIAHARHDDAIARADEARRVLAIRRERKTSRAVPTAERAAPAGALAPGTSVDAPLDSRPQRNDAAIRHRTVPCLEEGTISTEMTAERRP